MPTPIHRQVSCWHGPEMSNIARDVRKKFRPPKWECMLIYPGQQPKQKFNKQMYTCTLAHLDRFGLRNLVLLSRFRCDRPRNLTCHRRWGRVRSDQTKLRQESRREDTNETKTCKMAQSVVRINGIPVLNTDVSKATWQPAVQGNISQPPETRATQEKLSQSTVHMNLLTTKYTE